MMQLRNKLRMRKKERNQQPSEASGTMGRGALGEGGGGKEGGKRGGVGRKQGQHL